MFKYGDAVQIPGCTHKLRFLQASSGNLGLDHLMGGAMPNTCFCIIDEQKTRVYGDVLLRYFLSEGAHNGHDLLTAGEGASRLVENLPPKILREQDSAPPSVHNSTVDGDMKIAWRYSTMQHKSAMVTETKNRYDLGKSLENPSFQGSTIFNIDDFDYGITLEKCKEILARTEYNKKEKSKKRLLRIAIRGLGSPLWKSSINLLRFVVDLRVLCRDAYVVVMATLDSNILEPSTSRRLETCSDAFFRLVPIKNEEKQSLPILDKYDGYLQIVRLPRLTSLAPFKPTAVDLVFELHRKSFDVKILHLPPAFEDPSQNQKIGCSQVADAF